MLQNILTPFQQSHSQGVCAKGPVWCEKSHQKLHAEFSFPLARLKDLGIRDALAKCLNPARHSRLNSQRLRSKLPGLPNQYMASVSSAQQSPNEDNSGCPGSLGLQLAGFPNKVSERVIPRILRFWAEFRLARSSRFLILWTFQSSLKVLVRESTSDGLQPTSDGLQPTSNFLCVGGGQGMPEIQTPFSTAGGSGALSAQDCRLVAPVTSPSMFCAFRDSFFGLDLSEQERWFAAVFNLSVLECDDDDDDEEEEEEEGTHTHGYAY